MVTAVVAISELAAQTFLTVLNKTFTNPGITPTIIQWTTLLIIILVAAPLIGWLADRYGNFSIFKVGSTGLFISSVLFCSIMVYTSALGDSFVNYPVLFVALSILCLLSICCVIAIFTVFLQLGLDQLAYASSESIASFINGHFSVSWQGVGLDSQLFL